jgi:hypothetical protein
MANGYTVLHWNGFDRVIAKLEADGYRLQFACTYTDDVPKDVGYTGRENGWEMRRKLKAYCSAHDVQQYQIVRNTSYVQDLHGTVYELWMRGISKAAQLAERASA